MRGGTIRRALLAVALVAGVATTGLGTAPDVRAAPTWAPAHTARVHPGVMMVTGSSQCTANFVFRNGPELLLGYAAHCASPSPNNDGCAASTYELGTPVRIEGASRPGVLVYSSWQTMQVVGEKDPVACAFNDFALVRIDPADHAQVNPSIPHWGGPTGINRSPLPSLSHVYALGNSSLRQGLRLLQPKSGFVIDERGGGASRRVYTLLPGIPGDSGAAMLDARGAAAGVLSTIQYLPRVGSNGYANLGWVYDIARRYGFPDLRLAVGTQPFNPAQLPLGPLL